MPESPVSHGLGIGNGSLIEYSDGTVEYRQTGKILPAFKVRIDDVVGFSVRKATRDDKKRLKASALQEVLTVQGSGTTLAEVAVNYGTAAKVEEWFRDHARFGSASAVNGSIRGNSSGAPALVADELMKLAQLRDSGILTQGEFDVQKTRLLGYQ